MKRNAYILVLAAGVGLAAWQLAPARAPHEAAGAAPAKTIAPAMQSGYVAHFDENGKLVEEPAGVVDKDLNAALLQSINTSSEGLVEEASPVAGGGVMMDLQGRFESAATATVGADGKLHVPCLTNETDVQAFTSTEAAQKPAAKE